MKILMIFFCLNVSLSLVFSFLQRRGKAFSANLLTSEDIQGPYFKCDAAILLLQHGVDPNLYRLMDVWSQFSDHRHRSCVSFDVVLKTFLGAGYHLTFDDRNDPFSQIKDRLLHYGIDIDEPLSLKQLCRTHIRNQLRIVLNDTTILPSIEQLPIPSSLKMFLKLHDVIDLNNSSINCRIAFWKV